MVKPPCKKQRCSPVLFESNAKKAGSEMMEPVKLKRGGQCAKGKSNPDAEMAYYYRMLMAENG